MGHDLYPMGLLCSGFPSPEGRHIDLLLLKNDTIKTKNFSVWCVIGVFGIDPLVLNVIARGWCKPP